MKTVALLVFTIAFAQAYYLDHEAERQRREISWGKQVGNGEVYGSVGAPESGGAQGKLGYRGNIMDNNYGKLDGQAYGSRTLGLPEGPQTGYGGNLNWSGNRGSASVAAEHTRGLGTQFDARAAGTIHEFNKNARIEGYGSYSRSYGGPYGASRPNYGFGAVFRGRF